MTMTQKRLIELAGKSLDTITNDELLECVLYGGNSNNVVEYWPDGMNFNMMARELYCRASKSDPTIEVKVSTLIKLLQMGENKK